MQKKRKHFPRKPSSKRHIVEHGSKQEKQQDRQRLESTLDITSLEHLIQKSW